MKLRLSKYKIIALLGVLVVVMATTLLLNWLSRPQGEEYLALRLEAILSKYLLQPVQMDKLETNLFSRVEITGIRVISSDSLNTNVIEIPHLLIKYNLYSVIVSGIEIDSVLIDSFQSELSRDSLRGFNLNLLNTKEVDAKVTLPVRKKQNLSIHYINLTAGEFAFNDREIKLGGALHDISILTNLQELSRIDFNLAAESIELVFQEKSTSLGALSLSGDWTSPDLTIDSLRLSSTSFNLITSGRMSFVEPSAKIEAVMNLEAPLAHLLDSLVSFGSITGPQGDGQLEINLTVAGSLDSPDINAKVGFDGLSWGELSARDFAFDANSSRNAGVWSLQADATWAIQINSDSLFKPASISVSLTVADSLISVDDLTLLLPELTIIGKTAFRSEGDETRLNGFLTMKGSIGDVADIAGNFTSPIVADIAGVVDLALDINGSMQNPDLRVTGTIPSISRDRMALSNVRLSSEFRDGNLTLGGFAGDFSKGHISLNGRLEMATLRHNLTMNASGIDLNKLMSIIFDTDSPFEGFVNANYSSSGKLNDPSTYLIHANLSLDTVEFEDKAMIPLVAIIKCDSSRVELSVIQGEASIKAQGVLQNTSLVSTFTVHLPEIKPFAALVNQREISGNIDMSGSISGRYSNPKIVLSVLGTHCLYRAFPVDTISGEMTFIDGEFLFKEAYIAGRLESIDPNHPPFGLTEFSGGMNYSGNMNGSFSDPLINLSLNVNDVRYQNFSLRSGKVVIAASDRRITLKELQIDADSLRISGNGEYLLDSTAGRIRLLVAETILDSSASLSTSGQIDFVLTQSKKISILSVNGSAIPVGVIAGIFGQDIDGKLDLSLQARLGKDFAIDSLDLSLNDMTISKAKLDSLVVKGYLNSSEMTIMQINGYRDGNAFEGSAQLIRDAVQLENGWFGGGSFIKAKIKGEHLDFALIQPLLPVGYTAKGECELDLNVNGKIEMPKVHGFVKINEGQLDTDGDGVFLDSIIVDIAMSDTLILINSLSGRYKGITISAIADVEYQGINRIDLKAEVRADGNKALLVEAQVRNDAVTANVTLNEFNLVLIQPMIPGLDAFGGIASAGIAVSGTRNDLDFDGQLSINKMFISPTIVQDSLSNCSLNVRIDKREVNIVGFYGELGGGTIIANGRYPFNEDSIGSNLKIHINNSRLLDNKDYTLVVKQAELLIRQSKKQTLIEGDLVLGDSRLRYRFTPQMLISMLQSNDRPKQERSKFVQHIRLDVRIRDSEDLWIDNNLARLKLRADLAIAGDLANPIVSGRITTIEGYVLYLDRKFNVEKGSLDFYDPHAINPNIDLLATTIVKSYKSREETPHTISLMVNGELDKATVALTSVPPEDVSDIISLLTLGITRRDLTGVDGKQGDVKFQEAVRERLELITSRRVSGYVASNVENFLGLESFTIENNLFQFDKNWGPQLIASKKLSSRTELTYTTTVGRMNDQGIKLAYKLTERLAIEGQTDQVGRSGIDLTYKVKLP